MLAHKVKHHQQFSDCRHQLTPEQKERDTRVRRKDKLQPLCDGDSETVPGQAMGVGGQEVEQQPTIAAPASECYLECYTRTMVSL